MGKLAPERLNPSGF